MVRGAAAVAGLGSNIVLARVLSLSDYGVIALGLSWLAIAGTIACFGTETVTLRFVAEGLAKGDAAQAYSVARWGGRLSLILGSVVAGVSIVVLALMFDKYSSAQRMALWLIVCATPLFALSLNRAGTLRGMKRVVLGASVEALLRPLALLILAVALVLVLGSPLGAVTVAFAVIVAQSLPAGAGLFGSRVLYAKSSGTANKEQARSWRAVAVPIAVMNIMSVLIANTDTIAVGFFLDQGNAGVYRASFQLANLVAFGLIASNGIIAPLTAELFSAGQLSQLRRLLRYSGSLVAVGSVIGVAFMAIFGPALLGFFGPQYRTGYEALLILLIGQAINALCGPTGFMMSMTGHQIQAMRIFAVSTVANLGLNLLFVPHLGLIGGAIANVAGITLWNFSILYYLRRNLGIDPSIFSWISTGSNIKNDETR